MATIEELVVAARPEGLEETSEGFEEMSDDLEDVEGQMEDTTDGVGELASKWRGAIGAIVAGVAVAIGGLLTQVPILGQVASGFAAVIQGIAFQLDKRLRPVLQPVTEGLFQLGNAIASGDWDKVGQIFRNLGTTLGQVDYGQQIKNIANGIIQTVQSVNWGNLLKGAINGILNFIRSVDWLGWGATIIKGIASGVGSFVRSTDWAGWARWIINRIVQTIASVNWLQVGKDIVRGIINGLGALGEFVIGGAGDVANSIVMAILSTNWVSVGETIVGAVAGGLVQLGEFVRRKAGEFVDWIVEQITNIDWVGIGEGIARSIGNGLADAGEYVGQQAEDHIADPIARRVEGNSPPPEGPLSDIDKSGQNLVETFASGMQSATGTMDNVGAGMAESAGGGFSGFRVDTGRPQVMIDGRDITQETGRYRQDGTSVRGRFG